MKKIDRSSINISLSVSIILLLLSSCISRRHISKLRKPAVSISDTIKDFKNYNQPDFIKMEDLLRTSQERAQKSAFIKNIKENIYLIVDQKVAFTVILNGNEITIERGKKTGITPTLLIPFSPTIAQNLANVLEDLKLDQEEIFYVSYIVFIPCLNRMYSMPYLFETSMYKGRLDNYLQFLIKNPDGYTYHGQNVEISGTVVNVDGMFIIMPGLVGDPDIRLELTLDQAIELYKYVVYDAVKDQSKMEKMKLFKKYSNLVKECTIYERSWH
ncbi:MAG: hypothetical protein IPO85_00625 [Saprospiraceae bacterium]|uniref:Lipoprotein n=1 Tax=Candidatus Defluviibacterium haderslevense TaxID=2981993 RepID=A0A9D7S6U1_9BACT|nr:hypothetical protein [Candidatus Defluviibacterium haderslevense]